MAQLVPTPKLDTQSLIPPESTQTSKPRPTHLIPQQGLNSTGWAKEESSMWGNCFPPC